MMSDSNSTQPGGTGIPNSLARFKMRLGVIGAPAQWEMPDGETWAYEPYVREMRIWAELFSEVHVCGHASEEPIRGNTAPYLKKNIIVHPVNYTQDEGFSGARRRLWQFPRLIWHCLKTIRANDFILIRGPSHFALVGIVLTRLLRRVSLTKWAGANSTFKGERIPTRVNRFIEALPSKRNFTLVYGESHRSHQISFIPALMTAAELEKGKQLASERIWQPPWKIVGVGRLSRVKNYDLALRGVGELSRRAPEIPWTFTMVGDGPERKRLEGIVADYGIGDRVTFTGALPFAEAQHHFATAHAVIMPGIQEGWPKTIPEAWAHGAIPVAARGGIVPWMLKRNDSGVVFEATPEALAEALARLFSDPSRLPAISKGLFEFANEISLDQFKLRLERVLVERCGLQ
jgi:glycosyltransferase involved in cell wall biosynthesis